MAIESIVSNYFDLYSSIVLKRTVILRASASQVQVLITSCNMPQPYQNRLKNKKVIDVYNVEN